MWFKPSLASDETADIRQYALQNPQFPQQTTVDQWFDEAQFESYRKLGEFCAVNAFGKLKTTTQLNTNREFEPEDVKRLFNEIRENSIPPAPGFLTQAAQVLASLVRKLQEDVRP